MNEKHILIVSQNEDILLFLKDRLTQMNFDVIMCPEGLQRETRFTTSIIKGILLDLEMSGIDGVSALKYLRRVHPTVPIIAMSIYENVMELVQVIEEGATDYMLKPIDSDLLKEKCTMLFD